MSYLYFGGGGGGGGNDNNDTSGGKVEMEVAVFLYLLGAFR